MRPTSTRRWWRARSGQVMQMAAGAGGVGAVEAMVAAALPELGALADVLRHGADPPASGSGGSSPSSPTAPSSTWRSSPRRRSKRAAAARRPGLHPAVPGTRPAGLPETGCRPPAASPAVSCRPRTRSPVSRSGSEPDLAQLSLLAARSRCPENLVRGCGRVAGPGRCRSVARLVGWADLAIAGGRGWEYGRGLPVTPSARGMRARKFSLARELRPEGRLLLPLSTPVSIRGH
jgi:hypothetical protein